MERAFYRILVGGTDVSSRWRPLLISATINLTDGDSGSSADFDLDDSSSQISFPERGDDVAVLLGWEEGAIASVFEGIIDDVRSIGARGSGQTMRITAKSIDTTSKVKEPAEVHTDEKTLKKAAEKLAKGYDIDEVRVDEGLGKIERDYWSRQGESFMAWGARTAREIGANFQVNKKVASFTKRNAATSASGKPLVPVTIERGRNLINWDIAPFLGRPRYERARARYFDPKKAKFKEIEVLLKDIGSSAGHLSRPMAADEDHAKRQAESDKDEIERAGGEGTVLVDGDATAQPGAPAIVSRVRPGVDGQYKIKTVSHSISRGSGWTTSLEIGQPGSDTGDETRPGNPGEDVPLPPSRPPGI